MLKTCYLTLLMGPMIPIPAPSIVADALQSAQVTITSGQRSGFQLVFQSAGLQALLAAGYFDPSIRVVIMVTVGVIPTVLMDGIIVRQEVTPGNQPGTSTLTVTGEDLTILMDLTEIKGLPQPAMMDLVRVNLTLVKYLMYGIVPLVIPAIFDEVPLPTQRIPMQDGTDLKHIEELAKANGYVFYLDPGPLPGMSVAYWGPEIRVGIPQPALNINMDAYTNVESLSFSIDGSSRTNVGILIVEPNTKIGIPIPLPELSLLAPPLALKQAPALRFKALEGAAAEDPIKAMARGLGKASESNDAVTGSGSLDVARYGQPLKARALVGVRGAGIAFDGLYYVKSVTHNIKRGEYKQSFTLARNGTISLTPAVPT